MKWTLQSKLFFINLLIIQNETFVSYKSTNTALVQKGTIIFQIKIKIGKSPLNIRPFPLSFKKNQNRISTEAHEHLQLCIRIRFNSQYEKSK